MRQNWNNFRLTYQIEFVIFSFERSKCHACGYVIIPDFVFCIKSWFQPCSATYRYQSVQEVTLLLQLASLYQSEGLDNRNQVPIDLPLGSLSSWWNLSLVPSHPAGWFGNRDGIYQDGGFPWTPLPSVVPRTPRTGMVCHSGTWVDATGPLVPLPLESHTCALGEGTMPIPAYLATGVASATGHCP